MIQGPISVVCLSYKRPHLLRKALISILAQISDEDEVLVVDNKSVLTPDIKQVVEEFGKVKWIANSLNLGFADGMNRGIVAAKNEYVLLTEDDLELDSNCIQNLYNAVQSADLCGGLLVQPDNHQIEAAAGWLNFSSGYWGQNYYVSRMNQVPDTVEPIECDFVQGCLLLARKAHFLEHGGFRSDYFVYDEDIELCARWSRRGLKICFVPNARAFHLSPHQSELSGLTAFHHEKNFLANFILYAPAWRLPEVWLRFVVLRWFGYLLYGNFTKWWRLSKASCWVICHLHSLIPYRNGRRILPWSPRVLLPSEP
jgi:GT2 family glycosyltransferase